MDVLRLKFFNELKIQSVRFLKCESIRTTFQMMPATWEGLCFLGAGAHVTYKHIVEIANQQLAQL